MPRKAARSFAFASVWRIAATQATTPRTAARTARSGRPDATSQAAAPSPATSARTGYQRSRRSLMSLPGRYHGRPTYHRAMAPPARVSCLVGATGSGKTEAAIALARRIGAEVVCCDAMTVYRGLSILSAKPSPPPDVPHHLLDVVDPGESYSAARFVEDADRLVAEIRGRGRVPLVVGGTALYLKAWTKGLGPKVARDAALRARLEAEADAHGTETLHARLANADPARAAEVHRRDRRRIVRALEIVESTGVKASDLRREWDAP